MREIENDMSLRQYAAIKLGVPNSGTDWLDDMIRQSRRDEFAGKALAGMMSDPSIIFGSHYDKVLIGTSSYEIADAMIAASGSDQ